MSSLNIDTSRGAKRYFNFGRGKSTVTNIILHSSDGNAAGDLNTLTGGDPQHQVSANYYIERNGTIHQLVHPDNTAWHVGQTLDQGKYNNANSIGIEQEHIDGKDDWPQAQVTAAANLVHYLTQKYPGVNLNKTVLGHSDVAPERKQDPYNYPWDKFMRVSHQLQKQPQDDSNTPQQGNMPFKEQSLDDYLKAQSAPAKAPVKEQSLAEYVQGAMIDPNKAAADAISNYQSSIPAQNQTGDQMEAARKAAYDHAVANNAEIAKTFGFKAVDQKLAQEKKVFDSNVENARNPDAPQRLPDKVKDEAVDYINAGSKILDTWHSYKVAADVNENNPKAAGPNAVSVGPGKFGDPALGHIITDAHIAGHDLGEEIAQADPRYVGWKLQRDSTQAPVLQGMLGYPSGADTKTAVIPFAEGMLPGATNSPEAAATKTQGLLHSVQEKLNAKLAVYGADKGQDVAGLLAAKSRIDQQVSDMDAYMNKNFGQNQNGTGSGSTMGQHTEAALNRDQLGIPIPNPNSPSVFSSVGGQPPGQTPPTPPPTNLSSEAQAAQDARDRTYNERVSTANAWIGNILPTIGQGIQAGVNKIGSFLPENWVNDKNSLGINTSNNK